MMQSLPPSAPERLEILSTKGQKGDMLALKAATSDLNALKFPPEETREVARLFLEPILEKLNKKLPFTVQLLVMPSTTGKNRLPVAIAEVLKELKPGAAIYNENFRQVIPLHKYQSKQQDNNLGRMEDPIRYQIDPALIKQLKQGGRKVVLVDDVTSTLDSSRVLALQLRKEGIQTTGVVALRASATNYPTEKALVQTYQKIEPYIPAAQRESFGADYMTFFAYSSAAKLYRLDQKLNEFTNFQQVQQVITQGANHFRQLAGENPANSLRSDPEQKTRNKLKL